MGVVTTISLPFTIFVPLTNSQVAVGVSINPLIVVVTTHVTIYGVPATTEMEGVVATVMLLSGTVS